MQCNPQNKAVERRPRRKAVDLSTLPVTPPTINASAVKMENSGSSLWRCPVCGGKLIIVSGKSDIGGHIQKIKGVDRYIHGNKEGLTFDAYKYCRDCDKYLSFTHNADAKQARRDALHCKQKWTAPTAMEDK